MSWFIAILVALVLIALGVLLARTFLRANNEEQRDTEPHAMFSTTIRDGRDMPPIELNPAHVIPVTSAEQWRELVSYSSPEFEQAIRKASELPPVKLHAVVLTAEPTPVPKLNTSLPPLDFGELPDVTEDAVESESAAKVLSEPPPKGEVA